MDIEKIIAQKQNEAIEKEQLRLKKIEEEKQKEEEKIKKGIHCTIKSSREFIDIEEFINDFNKVNKVIFDIEEVSKNEIYFFKVKTEEEYSLIEEVFKSVLDKATVNFIKNNSLKDIVLSDINNGYVEDIQKSKESVLQYLEEDKKYSKEKKESYNEYLDVKIQDLKNKFTAALVSLYNIQEDNAINFVEIVYQQSNEYFEKYKNFGDMKPYTFQYNDKLNSKGLDNYSQTKNIDKLIEYFSENTSQYRRNETNFLTKLTNYVKKETGIKSLKLRDLKVWQDAYYSGDKEVMDTKNQELFNTLKNLKLTNCEKITSYPTFSFFNYYNMAEKGHNQQISIVREMHNVFSAVNTVKFADTFLNHVEDIIDKYNNNEEVNEDFLYKLNTDNKKTRKRKYS